MQERYGLRGNPSFALLDENGVVVERFYGPQPAETLCVAVETVPTPDPQ